MADCCMVRYRYEHAAECCALEHKYRAERARIEAEFAPRDCCRTRAESVECCMVRKGFVNGRRVGRRY